MTDLIFQRCKCAGRINDIYQEQDREQFKTWLLNEKEDKTEDKPTCKNLAKLFNSSFKRFNESDGCADCPIKDIINHETFKPLKLNLEVIDRLPKVPKFPIDLFPDPFKSYIIQASESVDCAIEYVALAMLAYWSVVVGLKQEMVVKYGYIQSASLYCAIVGMPSTGKSPGITHCRIFIDELESIERNKWSNEKAEYDKQVADYEEHKHQPGAVSKPEEMRTLRNYEIVDATREAACFLMKENPNGIINSQDELSGFFGGFDKYNRGSAERSFWLSVWNNTKVKVARRGSDDYVVDRPFCSIIGALLPDYLKNLKDRQSGFIDDGLSARFLYLYPKERYPMIDFDKYVNQGTEEDVRKCFQWMDTQTFEKLHRNYNCPGYVKFSSSNKARELYKEWNNVVHKKQMDSDLPTDIKIHYGKLDNYVIRLALIFHTMYEARNEAVVEQLSAKSMERAIGLVEKCFKKHIRKVYHYRSQSQNEKGMNQLLQWMLSKKEQVFSLTDLAQKSKPDGKSIKIGTIQEYCNLLYSQGRGIILAHKKDGRSKKSIYVFKDKE